jgi:DNA-binding NarL/FixJ family response regulator
MAAPIRVLIADDTAHVRRMLRSMLELDGFEVVADVGTGTEVTDLVATGVDVDVIVLDERMPDLDGVETARQVRAARPEQVVLLYTAFPHAALERAAAEAGVAAVLGKVDGLESLEREITRHCTTLF